MTLPAVDGSPTSIAAADAAAPLASARRRRVYDFLDAAGPRGRTDEELILSLCAEMPVNGIRARRVELVAAGLVVDSGTTRLTRCRREAVVWIAKRHAEQQLSLEAVR